ncbi:MAG: FHA domain-containing protein [Armatimonadota bacterium]
MKRYVPALALLLLALPVGAQQNAPAAGAAPKPAGNSPAAPKASAAPKGNAPAAATAGNAPANAPAGSAPAGNVAAGNAPAAAAEPASRSLTIKAPSGGEYSAYLQEAPSTLKSFTDQAQLEAPAGQEKLTLFVLDKKSGYAARRELNAGELPAEISVAGPDFTLLQKVRVAVTGKDDKPVAAGTVQLSDGDGNTSMRVLQPASQGVAEFDFVRKGEGQVTVSPEGGDGSATTKSVNLDLPPGQTAQLLTVSMPEVTAVVEPPVGSAAPTEPASSTPAPEAGAAAPQSGGDGGGQWGSTVIGFLFLILLVGGAYYYAKTQGITIDTVLKKLGVQPDVVGAGGASLAGANAAAGAPAPGPAPAPPPVVADPNQCQFCGQMKDPSGACACTVTPGAPAAASYGSGYGGAAAAGGSGPRLVGMGGEYMGHVFPIAGSAVIGREPANDIPLDRDTTTSRRHAQIAADGAGGYRIQDLGSSNGTYVNGARVSDGPLNPGDEVSIGGTRFRFEV